MKISDITLEMELGGVDSADIAEILQVCSSKGFDKHTIDDELIKHGYEKMFTVDYDTYDESEYWDDDEYYCVEKFPHKQKFTE